MQNIGQRIKELRKKNGLTQEKLADYLSVTNKSVSKWECGLTTPDLALIGPLTKILHVSADELLGLTSEDTDTEREKYDKALQKYYAEMAEAVVQKLDAVSAMPPVYQTDAERAAARDFFIRTCGGTLPAKFLNSTQPR